MFTFGWGASEVFYIGISKHVFACFVFWLFYWGFSAWGFVSGVEEGGNGEKTPA